MYMCMELGNVAPAGVINLELINVCMFFYFMGYYETFYKNGTV